MTGKTSRSSLNRRRLHSKARSRDEYLRNIQRTLWRGHEIPSLPPEAVADLATELFSSSCSARSLAGLHLPEAVQLSCKGRMSPCSLVLALLYLERLKAGGELATEYLSEVTPSELFIVSMMVANKFLQDDGDSSEVENWFWSKLSGFEMDHVNKLEKNFLAAIKWKIYVSNAEFWQRIKSLHRTVSLRQGSRRGWFNYDELCSLLDTLPTPHLFHAVVQVSAVCLISYLAAVAALLGAAIISAHLQHHLMDLHTNTLAPMENVPTVLLPCKLLLPPPDTLVPPEQAENDSLQVVFLHYLNESRQHSSHQLDTTWQQLLVTYHDWLVQRHLPHLKESH